MMKSLRVQLSYPMSRIGSTSEVLTLPVRVLDAEGTVLADSAASEHRSLELKFPDHTDPAFVRLTWPSGKSELRRIDFKDVSNVVVTFDDSLISRNEWATWAVPRLQSSFAGAASTETAEISKQQTAALGRVWLRLWRFSRSRWTEVAIAPVAQQRSNAAYQLDFDLAQASWLLQFGATRVAWTFVSLPGGGPCRVLLTPNTSTDPRADHVRAVVTGFRSTTETLLEFLSRDALRAAGAVAADTALAETLLLRKSEDPVAAVAGAYYLLRTKGWKEIPTDWFDHLHRTCPWMVDTAIIRMTVLVRSGLRGVADMSQVTDLMQEAMRNGLPVFAEGLTLLQEAASILRTRRRRQSDLFLKIERLAASQAWAGASLGYYGRTPEEPSPQKIYGTPTTDDAPRDTQSLSLRVSTPRKRATAHRRPPHLVFLKDLSHWPRG